MGVVVPVGFGDSTGSVRGEVLPNPGDVAEPDAGVGGGGGGFGTNVRGAIVGKGGREGSGVVGVDTDEDETPHDGLVLL